MGVSRTTSLAFLCLASLTGALPARAHPLPDLPNLAACTGRLSALMEHQFLTDGPASETTRARRDALADILAAITPPEAAAEVLGWRIEAKAAQAALLSQATFGHDPDRRMARRAERLVAPCTGLLLS